MSGTPDRPALAIVQTTLAPPDQADRLATALVESRLAACVHLFPVTSTYRWKGSLEHASEVVLQAKTRADRVPALMDAIRARHPYELPEIIVIPIHHALPAYAAWIHTETTDAPATSP
jgi:periplasmic divalent cation tolerance protein